MKISIKKIYNGSEKQKNIGIAGKIFFHILDESGKMIVNISGMVRYSKNGQIYLAKRYGINKYNDKTYYDVELSDTVAREVLLKATQFAQDNNLDVPFLSNDVPQVPHPPQQQSQQPQQQNQAPQPNAPFGGQPINPFGE